MLVGGGGTDATPEAGPARYVPVENLEGRFVDRAAAGRITSVLGGDGRDWAIDREFAARVSVLVPAWETIARENRAFVARAVRWCVARGVRQFVDVGCGYPTTPPVHTVAARLAPECRWVYVDVDAIAVAHFTAVLREQGESSRRATLRHNLRAIGTRADPRCGVRDVWTAVRRTGLIDDAAPVAVLLSGALHHIAADDGAETALAAWRSRLPPGSYLIVSHATADTARDEQAARLAALGQLYARGAAHPLQYRNRDQLADLLHGYDLLVPESSRCLSGVPAPRARRVWSGLPIVRATTRRGGWPRWLVSLSTRHSDTTGLPMSTEDRLTGGAPPLGPGNLARRVRTAGEKPLRTARGVYRRLPARRRWNAGALANPLVLTLVGVCRSRDCGRGRTAPGCTPRTGYLTGLLDVRAPRGVRRLPCIAYREVLMTDPIVTAVASALAGKAAEAVASGGRTALASLYQLVRDKFSTRRRAARTLERAVAAPEDDNVRALAEELQHLVTGDSAFATRLGELWEQAKDEQQHAETGGVINEIGGTVAGNSVQARDIQGDVRFG